MKTKHYPSNVTDAQWTLIEPLLPVYPRGRPLKTAIREMLDTVFYLLHTGCSCYFFPDDYRPCSTVWRYFEPWRHNGTLERIHDTLRVKVDDQEKLSPGTTAGGDIQSVDTACGGEQRGRDNSKNIDGQKRRILMYSLGLLLAALLTAANIDDTSAAQSLLDRLKDQPMASVRRMFSDDEYHNQALHVWVDANPHWNLVIVRRPEGQKGWMKLPLRWTVEQTFAWLSKCQRLNKDCEKACVRRKHLSNRR